MENPKAGAAENPSNVAANPRRRTPFTALSQVDADLALARTLQEQERAYMMLRMNSVDGGGYGSWGSVGNELQGMVDDDDASEDAFDVNGGDVGADGGTQNAELDPSDEAYARALQDAEERDMASRLLALAGMSEMVAGEHEHHDEDEDEDEDEDDDEDDDEDEDSWEEIDPDEMSYEELIALGDVIGTESRGLSAVAIASLPSITYKSQCTKEQSRDSCVICRQDYEDGETLTVLSCKHLYHSECINNWLQINKVCPVCNAEVSTSGKS